MGALLDMKLYIFPPSARVLGIVALKNYLALDCEVQPIDLGRGDQLTPQYLAQSQSENADAGGRWFRALGSKCHLVFHGDQAPQQWTLAL
jgi:hypothetical protein